jgi:hypothetical protein
MRLMSMVLRLGRSDYSNLEVTASFILHQPDVGTNTSGDRHAPLNYLLTHNEAGY